MRKLTHLLVILTLTVLVFNKCAKVSQPTGGPKDTIPPVLEFSVPKNESLNYKGRSIELKFDEFVKADKLRQELIITPKYDGNVTSKVNKYTVSLELDEPLDDSTTYTFTFRESIADITENNSPKNLIIAFSTGDYIDSIYVEGEVRDLYTNEPMKDALVGLYLVSDSLFLFDGPPTYFTEADEEGKFRINNIKSDEYILTANLDENSNLKSESDKESHGFYGDTLRLTESYSDLIISMRIQDVRPIKLNSSRPSGQYYELRYNKPLVDFNIIESKANLVANLVEQDKIIRIYPTTTITDSLKIIVESIDTIRQKSLDTMYVKFPETKRDFEEFKSTIDLEDKAKINEDVRFRINFSKPVLSYSLDSLFFEYDSLNRVPLTEENLRWNKFKDILFVNAKLDSTFYFQLLAEKFEGDSLAVTAPQVQRGRNERGGSDLISFISGKGTFMSADGDSSRLMIRKMSFKKANQLGLLAGEITTDYPSFIIQLTTGKYEVVAEIKNQKAYTFREIEPGKYKIRVLIDLNEDGVWDPGNILEGIAPEPVYFNEKEIPVRANWEIYGENFSIKPVDKL